MTYLTMYANRFNGGLPPPIVGGNYGASHRLYNPELVPGNAGFGGNTRNAYEGWTMLGMLYGTGIIVKTPSPDDPPPVMLYCSEQQNPLLKYPDGWYPSRKRGGYAYRIAAEQPLGPPYLLTTPAGISEHDHWSRIVGNPSKKIGPMKLGRYKKTVALISDIVYGDDGFGSGYISVWPHTTPPHFIVGYSDGHVESIRVPMPVYNASKKVTTLNQGDGFIVMMFQAADTHDFKRIPVVFPN